MPRPIKKRLASAPVDREEHQPARFRVGDKVHTRRMNPEHHTRLPRYAHVCFVYAFPGPRRSYAARGRASVTPVGREDRVTSNGY